MNNINKTLFERNLLTNTQYEFLESIRTRKIVSLYYELRLLLYLGIMLFTGGVGYFAYQNIGDVGHILSMIAIGIFIVIGFIFIGKYAQPYSNKEVRVTQVYFDYILILISLLIITLFTYIQVYYNLVEQLLNFTSFLTAALFLFMAYRYDNRALLSMAITVLAAAFGIAITPINWASGDWMVTSNLYNSSIVLGIVLLVSGQLLHHNNIKQHFRFTFLNFGLMLFYIGCISAIFDSELEIIYALITVASSLTLSYYTWKNKEFLFFLYSNIAAYISFTYLLFTLLDKIHGDEIFFAYYIPISCIGYIVFLVNKKSHFSHDN